MKVAFVNSMRSIGGGERWLLETAVGLKGRGHEVSVVARTGSMLGEAARAEGHPVLEIPMSGDLDLLSVLRLTSWLKVLRPDVLSVNVQRAVRIGCAAARLAGLRTVVERRGLNFHVRPTALNRWVYGRCVSLVIANCGEIADALVSSGLVSPGRVAVVHNGIDAARVPSGGGERVRAELGIRPDVPLVSMVARLVRDKGHVYALEAMALVRRTLPDARLLLVGAGKLESELRNMARNSLPDGAALFLGRRDDVPAILDASDALLVTSLREGMPHSVLEAMVAGTPVVATAVAGIPEMLADGSEGLLVPPGAAEAAAAAVVRVLSDRGLAHRLSEAARARVLREFTLEGMVEAVERSFESAIGKSDPEGGPV